MTQPVVASQSYMTHRGKVLMHLRSLTNLTSSRSLCYVWYLSRPRLVFRSAPRNGSQSLAFSAQLDRIYVDIHHLVSSKEAFVLLAISVYNLDPKL
jgi:hypothetical protein